MEILELKITIFENSLDGLNQKKMKNKKKRNL